MNTDLMFSGIRRRISFHDGCLRITGERKVPRVLHAEARRHETTVERSCLV